MMVKAAGVAVAAAGGLLAYGVRGKSASLLAPSVWRGCRDHPYLALTFDDGPSESTPALLEILAAHGVTATFFQCGANVRRLPEIARAVASAGHEIGNHSDTHARLYLRTAGFIERELERAQATIGAVTGRRPVYFRAPFGARWFGLRRVQRRLGLLGVMWTVMAADWRWRAGTITAWLLWRATNGAILCLHDGRELRVRPEIGETLEAVRRLVPSLLARGFQFVTIDKLLCPTSLPNA